MRPAFTLANFVSGHERLQLTGVSIAVVEIPLESKGELVATWRELGSLKDASYLKLIWSPAKAVLTRPE